MQVPELEASETWYARFYTLAGGELAKVVSHTLVHAWHRHASGAYADCCRLAVALLDRSML
jgi:hypothetical protein